MVFNKIWKTITQIELQHFPKNRDEDIKKSSKPSASERCSRFFLPTWSSFTVVGFWGIHLTLSISSPWHRSWLIPQLWREKAVRGHHQKTSQLKDPPHQPQNLKKSKKQSLQVSGIISSALPSGSKFYCRQDTALAAVPFWSHPMVPVLWASSKYACDQLLDPSQRQKYHHLVGWNHTRWSQVLPVENNLRPNRGWL